MIVLKKYGRIFILLLIIAVFQACGGEQDDDIAVNNRDVIVEAPKVVKPDNNDSSPRDIWQQRGLIVSLLGDLSGKSVADIGAGTGFFTFPLAAAADKVIALDISQAALDIIDAKKSDYQEDFSNKIETRLAGENDSNLEEQEVDVVIIINTIAYIEDRVNYLKKLKSKIKDGGRLMIVDFKKKRIPIQIVTEDQKLPLGIVELELQEAGYQNFQSDDCALDYQWIIIADKD